MLHAPALGTCPHHLTPSSPVPRRVFHAPARFHPGYSLLGRWLRRRTGDARYAEALHVLVLTGLALVLLFGHFLSAALLLPAAAPQTTTAYWLVQASLAGLALAAGVVGFRPALAVACTSDALHLAQGRRRLVVPYAALASVRRITARRFHRHERRYAATRAFLGVLGGEVLLLRLARGGPVVVGLPAPELAALHALLDETARASMRTEGDFATERAGEREHGSKA